ncbi:DUF6368 family protein [Streptomyces sp. NPDC057611]|uniref:DUF6368 family protein n=1 Tax=Streptomyces sp. NPDC057611 TaxID=3346182 RepID=UPI00368726C1
MWRAPLIGFSPTYPADVIAFCNAPVDHVVTALQTAAVMDVIGGVANAEPRKDQVPIVVGLPCIVTTMTDPWPAAYGSAEFLRAWAQQPGFRLLKQLLHLAQASSTRLRSNWLPDGIEPVRLARALTRSAARSPHGGWDGHRARLTARVLRRPGEGRRRPARRRGPVRSR